MYVHEGALLTFLLSFNCIYDSCFVGKLLLSYNLLSVFIAHIFGVSHLSLPSHFSLPNEVQLNTSITDPPVMIFPFPKLGYVLSPNWGISASQIRVFPPTLAYFF